ncbi:unnamed protein product [Trypanosoma congolense IL3000]|uniref:WGS project CAEQ00000000 data, annotated contig 2092 n=1 Tax=Trypanosoma congolense (strain IL3000) TaxID=1068625 RepID=F9WBE1_TRYCI|nr:unnamed protein product [Trypanosoma congolense IL3000]
MHMSQPIGERGRGVAGTTVGTLVTQPASQERQFMGGGGGGRGAGEDTMLETIMAAIAELTLDVKTVKADINSVKADINSVKADINSVKADINSVKADINSVRRELKEDINSVKADINSVSERVDELGEKFEAQNNGGVKVLDGVYDSVMNAEWSHVVVNCAEHDEKWLGMDVSDAKSEGQPQLWSGSQAHAPYDPEEPWEGDEVPGVSGKLVMVTLKSKKGWPYMPFDVVEGPMGPVETLTGYDGRHDAYIRKENFLVWHTVKEMLDKWLENKGIVRPFIVVGTPGIGKSFGTGSLLLYQLLHHPSDKLKVVAYFVRGEAYIFHKEGRRVVHYEEEKNAVKEINGMARNGIKGYAIYDICGESGGAGRLTDKWGIVLISSPNVNNFQKFKTKRPDTLSIYMNCYENVEFKAVLAWERHSQVAEGQINREDVNLEEDWKKVEDRIHMVGPLPRYVLGGEKRFFDRLRDVQSALYLVSRGDIKSLMKVMDRSREWHDDGTTHKLVRLVRHVDGKGKECRNQPTSVYVWKELQANIDATYLYKSEMYRILSDTMERGAYEFETAGLRVFMAWNVMGTLLKHLKHLPRGNEAMRCSVLSQRGAKGRMPTSFSQLTSDGQKQALAAGYLYRLPIPNFPLVDSFFVVEGTGAKTIVLLQVTKAQSHHTKKTTVRQFRKYMGNLFERWEETENYFNWEIIYIQHANSTAIYRRQDCFSPGGVANDTDIALWDNIHQYQLTLNAPIANLFLRRGVAPKACPAKRRR